MAMQRTMALMVRMTTLREEVLKRCFLRACNNPYEEPGCHRQLLTRPCCLLCGNMISGTGLGLIPPS